MLSRLLREYPADKLEILDGSYYHETSPMDGRLPCSTLTFPTTNGTGRLGVGRLKGLLDWLRLPVLVVVILRRLARGRADILLTVADGQFFLAAAAASAIRGVPLVLIVHDDWVTHLRLRSRLMRRFAFGLFRWAGRTAAHILAISPAMQQLLQDCGLRSEVQYPATEHHPDMRFAASPVVQREKGLRIAYFGTLTQAVEDSIAILVEFVQRGCFALYGLPECFVELHIPEGEKRSDVSLRDLPCRVHWLPWVDQAALPRVMANADILFLPFSFKPEQRFATARAFPTKAADYFASGKPVLILAPADSTLAQYGRHFGCAEVVDQPSVEALADGLARICNSEAYRVRLRRNAFATFERNHNIAHQRERLYGIVTDLTTPEDRSGAADCDQ